jgi:hypothetical protein
MEITSSVEVNGAAIRAGAWEVGHQAGAPVADWQITPYEAATQYDPPDVAGDIPVNIKVTALGTTYDLLAGGRLNSVSDQLTQRGVETRIAGVDGAWRLFEKGPLRDTVFVSRTIIRERYPRGMVIATLNGDQVLGLPPDRYRIRRDNDDPNVLAAGKAGVYPYTQMMEETEWLNKSDTICDPMAAFQDAYAKANLPEFVIVGGDRGLKVKTFLDQDLTTDDDCEDAKVASKRIAGGVNALTINHLIELLAKKAGFSSVKINTPDLPMFEPFTVNAGQTWYAAIQSLVGPWNPLIYVWGNVLHIIDVEAADIVTHRAMTLSAESVTVLNRSVSRIPPHRGVNVLGPLRAGLEAMREFRRGNPRAASDDDDCRPPINGGMSCAQDGLPPNFSIAPPPKHERVSEYEREERDGVGEVLIAGEMPYNIEVVRSYGPPSSSLGPQWSGAEKIDWTRMTVRKFYFADPALGRIQLRYLERTVHGGVGGVSRVLSRQSTRIIQGRFGNNPCQVIQEERAHVRLPGLPFGGERLIRRTITTYSENLSVEGTWDSTTDEYVLTIFTIGDNLEFYKPIPYQEAAHSGTIDLSGNSLDSWQMAHYSRTTESYQVIDKYFAQKETAKVYSFGGHPPEGDVEVFMYNQPEGGIAPAARQRYCFGVNIDGALVQSILAVGAATEEQAELIAARAERRGGQRQVRAEVELPTYLPRIRPGMGITIAPTAIRSLNQANTAMVVANRIEGDFFISGYRYVNVPVGQGIFRVRTRLSLRSRF